MTNRPLDREARIMPWSERLLGPENGRQLVVATLVSTFGSGIYASTVVFYLTGRGAALTEVGTWMTIGGTASIVASPQLATVLGRFRPGVGLVGLHLARSAIFFTLPALPLGQALPLVAGAIVLDKASAPLLQAFVTIGFPGPDRLRVLGYRRAVANFGLGAGTAAGGLLLAAHSKRALAATLVVNAVTFIYAAYVIWKAAKTVATRQRLSRWEAKGSWSNLRDLRNRLTLIFLCGILTVYDVLLTFGIPTIVLTFGIAAWWSSVALGLSFAIVSSLQVKVTNLIDKRATSNSRLGQSGGLLIACGCLLIATADASPVVGLLGAVACWSLAELSITNLLWRLPLALEEHPVRMSDLIAQLSLGTNAAVAAMPLIIATIVAPYGAVGWAALAGSMLVPTLASSGRTLREVP